MIKKILYFCIFVFFWRTFKKKSSLSLYKKWGLFKTIFKTMKLKHKRIMPPMRPRYTIWLIAFYIYMDGFNSRTQKVIAINKAMNKLTWIINQPRWLTFSLGIDYYTNLNLCCTLYLLIVLVFIATPIQIHVVPPLIYMLWFWKLMKQNWWLKTTV